MNKLDKAIAVIKRDPMRRNTDIAREVGCCLKTVVTARKVSGAPPRRMSNNSANGLVKINLFLPHGVLNKIDAAAAADGKSRNGFLLKILKERFGE